MNRRYFGTDGVRGPYGGPVMNEAFAWRLGAAAGRLVRARPDFRSEDVFIGRDTRSSGSALEHALAAGLESEGFDPISLGVVPTPVVSLVTRSEAAALGVVITASHNPAADNGIKFFGPAGVKLTDADELRMEQLMPAEAGPSGPAVAIAPFAAPLERYFALTRALLPAGSLAGWRIALDTAHGAGCATSPRVLEGYGAELIRLGDAPDGRNINDGVGSEHAEKLCATVRAAGARLGIAHDGDADRCVLCDESGSVLDGDEILTILALHALRAGKLPNQTLVVTVQSNLGVDAAVAAAGGRVCRSAVGDRYVVERMLAEGATLGGESSGHVVCAEISPTGDGLVAALKVIEVMLATGRPLSELRRALAKFPQRSVALTVREKRPLETLAALPCEIAAIEREFGPKGRVLVRYSGTEPKLRLLVEGPADAAVRAALARLEAAARADLTVV
ncbi:MAG TPA: phosphoglucosamine mutase [Lacunisphaera sp.]|nr:phosphoglucosamine mutase [Lacunisphaera sp.]